MSDSGCGDFFGQIHSAEFRENINAPYNPTVKVRLIRDSSHNIRRLNSMSVAQLDALATHAPFWSAVPTALTAAAWPTLIALATLTLSRTLQHIIRSKKRVIALHHLGQCRSYG